jgi:hypothetical protein
LVAATNVTVMDSPLVAMRYEEARPMVLLPPAAMVAL